MTVVALHAAADRAVIVTDSWWYSPSARDVGHGTKTVAYPHLQAAHIVQGCSDFATAWAGPDRDLAGHVGSFDEYLQRLPRELLAVGRGLDATVADLRAADPDSTPAQCGRANVFVVGYSPKLGRYRAVLFAQDHAFMPTPLDGPVVMPSPLSVRPSRFERRQIEATFAAWPHQDDAGFLADWAALPKLQAPESLEEWARLVAAVHVDRTRIPLASRMKVLTGGTVWATVLEAGGVLQVPIARFGDDLDAARAALAGTMHPVAQLAPCWCGSGVTFRECCLAKAASEPCSCGRPRPARDCCMLTDDEATEWAARLGEPDFRL